MCALAGYVWSRRRVAGAYVLFAALLSIADLCISGGLEGRSTTLAGHVFWQHVQILGYGSISVCWLLLVLEYTGRHPSPRRAAMLFLVPVAAVAMHWTNGWHHLYWKRVWIDRTGPAPIMGREYGAGFWVFVAYSYLLLAAGVFVLLRFQRQRRTQSLRTLILLAAMLPPSLASLLYMFEWFPIRYFDITPYALAITGVCLVWVIFLYQFQGIVPVAARAVVESMADGIIVLDIDRRVADLNPAAEVLLGCRKEQLAGLPAADAFRDWTVLAQYHEGDGPIAGDVSLPHGGHPRLCAVGAVDVTRGGRRIGRVITLRDVSAEREASRQLEAAREAAEAAAVAKSRFLANMSHEIRTPMNGVVGATELLLDSGLNDEQSELVRTAQESAHSLLSILNDILDFSKIDAGKLELDQIPFDLPRFMDSIVRLMQPLADKKGLELKVRLAPEAPRVVVGDPTRVRQILLNLTGNAIKFTAAGRVSIELDRLPAAPGQTLLAIAVEDTGIGIAPERIGALFQEFTQADSSVTRNFGGTGLGLAISQRLIEKMGGTIRVESAPGRGSRFTIELPVRLGEARDVLDEARAGLAGSETFPGCRVLLTEDNPVNQKIGQRILEKLGCRAEVANDGHAAVMLAAAAPYDVILMDLHMPEVDGFEAAREIRRRGIRTPIVALTASVLDETRKACEEAGMNGFLTKPIRVDEIVAVLKTCRGGQLQS